MHIKTIVIVAGVALGIAVGYVSSYATEIALGAIVLAAVQALIMFMTRKTNGEVSSKRQPEGLSLALYICLFSSAMFVGVLRVQIADEAQPFVCDGVCIFDAVITSTPERKDTYQLVKLQTTEDNRLFAQARVPLYPRFAIGDTVHVTGKVSLPDTIYPHGDTKSFDYESYLRTQNVGSQMLFPKLEVIDDQPHTFAHMLGRLREHMVENMNHAIRAPASSLASGMLFGDQSFPKELKDVFRTAGLSHIIVLSGFNIALVISFVMLMLRRLPLTIRIVAAFLFVIMFVCMVGAEPSVLRATVMSCISLLAVLVGRQYAAHQALMISFLGIIMYEPYALLHDVSLHLSFLATAGIVYGAAFIDTLLTLRISYPSFRELLTTTLAAYVTTLPYLMYTFGSVSVYALIANVLVLPLVPAGMLLSFLTLCMSFVAPSVTPLFGYVTSMLLDAIIALARAVTLLPFATVGVEISFSTMCLLYVCMIVGSLWYVHTKKNETWQTTNDGYLTGTISY